MGMMQNRPFFYQIGFQLHHRTIAIMVFLFMFLMTLIPIISLNPIEASPRQQNNPPVAVISSPENADVFEVNQVVHFDGSSSTDPDNDILTYNWDFGDGETAKGSQVNHIYTRPSVPIVTLVVDDGSLNDTARVVIIIGTGGGQNRPPRANIDSPNNFDTFSIGEVIIFDGSSSTDLDNDLLTYNWNFGDGNTSTGIITTHAYGEKKPYAVSLTVNDGMFNDSERIVIFVNNTPPIADAGGDKLGYLGEELLFDGSNSSDPDRIGGIENYTWDMGDNTKEYGAQVTHRFFKYGAFKVKLTVTDNHGDTDIDEIKVTIKNAPPVAVIQMTSKDAVVNTFLEFDASNSYDPDGDVEEYYFQFGDGTETDWIYEPVITHKYDEIGEYKITLEVRDDLNENSEPDSIIINVKDKVNSPPTVKIVFPIYDDSVAGTIIIKGTATDSESEVDKVEVRINDDRWDEAEIVDTEGNSVNWEYTWDTEEVPDGEYQITTRAWDGEKYSSEASVRVLVNNRPTTYIDLTEELAPEKTGPSGKVVVSGYAVYDTNVPVSDTKVEIKIIETDKIWLTKTNDKGEYSANIIAPSDPGKYTVRVYITDGILERERSKKLDVEAEPPDLTISQNDIEFSKNRPSDKDNIEIFLTVHNIGGSSATCTVNVYQDAIKITNIIGTKQIEVPEMESSKISLSWKANSGVHNIIAVITEVTPQESDSNNNQAITKIVVSAPAEDNAVTTGGTLIEEFQNLPILYRYVIIVIIILLILVLFIGLYLRSRSKSKENSELSVQAGMGRVENLPLTTQKGTPQGMVVFKPLSDDTDTSKTRFGIKSTNADINKQKNVKFETINLR